MDFSKFRESGELSDLEVVVGEREFKLHKFPLYTRSDFFRALARSENGKVTLDEFPGGPNTFEMVANYCYNKRIDVTNENICKLRCAAEFLQMCSPGNLADCADRYLLDVLTTAKLSRDMSVIIDIVMKCKPLGAIAEQAGIISKCISAIVDCWLLSSRWSRKMPSDRIITESSNFRKLCKFPLNWYQQLFCAAREKNVRSTLLAKLAQIYIMDKIQRKEKKEKQSQEPKEVAEDKKEPSPEEAATVDSSETENKTADEVIENADEESKQASDDDKKSSDKEEDTEKEETEKADTGAKDDEEEEEEEEDLKAVMDTLLLALPDNTPLTETFDPECTSTMLRVADSLQCECRTLLSKLAGRLLCRFTPEGLAELSPDLLQEIIREASKDPVQADPDSVCAVVDGYLLELAERDTLTVEIFQKLVESVPKEHRQSHDALFKILEKLIKSDKKPVSDEDKTTLMNMIDFRRLSEAALQEAHDSKLVPDPYVTKAALALCAKLRAELDTARTIIRNQEEDLYKYGLTGGRASSWLHGVDTDYGIMTTSEDTDTQETAHYSNERRSDVEYEESRYSPPGYDPILEKALGGRYYDDPFHVDSLYPYTSRYTPSTRRRSSYDNSNSESWDVTYRSYSEPFVPRSSYFSSRYQTSKW